MSLRVCLWLAATAVAACGALPPMPEAYRADVTATVAAAARVSSRMYPDADTVVLDDRLHARYAPDGTDVSWDDEWVKVLTERGRRQSATVSLDYNARYGDVEIQCVEIVGTNGVVRTVDFARTLKTTTDNSSLSANIVDPQDKKCVCAVPGLAVGEIRHVIVCRRTRKPRMKGAWADLSVLEHFSPIVSTVVTVEQPSARPLAKAVLRHPHGATVTRAPDRPLADGYTLLAWTARDVPQVFPEPDMPPLTRCAQTLRLSTVPDWGAVSRWYWSLCAEHLARTTPAMSNHVARLVKDCPDGNAKIRALFKFVSQEVRYMGLTLEDEAPGYEPHDVNVTFENRYGVCRDKAALLTALLRLAGIPAFPVLIHAGTKKDAEVADPFFNHAVTAVTRVPDAADPSPYLLMDPTDESTRDLFPAYLSDRSYLVARPEGETLRTSPVPPAAANDLAVTSVLALAGGNRALYTADMRFTGLNDNAFRRSFLTKKPEDRRRQVEGWLRRMSPGAELLTFRLEPADLRDTETPLAVHLSAQLPGLVISGRARETFSPPLFTRGLNLVDMILDGSTALETRRFPLQLNSTCAATERLTVETGDLLGANLALPADVAVTNAPGYAFTRTVERAGNRFVWRRRLSLDDVNFDLPAYEALRNARKEVETAERAQPVFARPPDAEAHVRLRLRWREFHFRTPYSWVETNTVVREALTYQGKRNLAELKFPYSPCVQTAELVSAVVSNRDGRVFAVKPREINTLDCGWAAAAPRYPASKLLVANLPGVEIGSIVSHTCATVVTNAPVAYAAGWTFDGAAPIDRIEVICHVPAGMPWRTDDAAWPAAAKTVNARGDVTTYRYVAERPKRLRDEPGQPPAELWRKHVRVSAADWRDYGTRLDDALAAARDAGSSAARAAAAACTENRTNAADRIRAIRTFLAHRVRTAGPGLFELPFDRAFTAPDRVLAEGYGSAADRMNLFHAMLEAAGFDCSFVLADNAGGGLAERVARRRDVPDPEWYDSLLIRAVPRAGLFAGFLAALGCGEEPEDFILGGENEYTPPAASAHWNEGFFDPRTGGFGRLSPKGTNWTDRTVNRMRYTVRANGATDVDVRSLLFGAGTGGYRKRFAEMLPEMRGRFYQQLVGELAQNATATGDLVTDTASYPAETAFSAYVEGFAVVQDDAITVTLPDFTDAPFVSGDASRTTPFMVGAKDYEEDVHEVVFPAEYTRVEHLPADLDFREPAGRAGEWYLTQRTTAARAGDGAWHVTVVRRAYRDRAHVYAPDHFPIFREWNRRATSPAERTITLCR